MTSATVRSISTPRSNGPEASDKQLYATVRYGRRCTFHVAGQDPIEGYVVGIDRYTYVVLATQGHGFAYRRCIIHKATASPIWLHEQATLDDEPEDVQLQIAPFRKWVLSNIFGATHGASAPPPNGDPS
jgi:hypothetical protein